MHGFTQEQIEKQARWFAGNGCVFAEDFILKHVGADRMKKINLTGAYIIKSDTPVPCMFITFGAGGSWTPDLAITKQCCVSRTEAECKRLGTFMYSMDPENKYNVRSWHYHIDLSKARVVRRPTDIEIAQLQLDYRDQKNIVATNPMGGAGCYYSSRNGGALCIRKKRPTKRKEEERLTRELRALDRRRFNDAGIHPPEERLEDEQEYMKAIKYGPRGPIDYPRRRLDGYRSDTSSEKEDEEEEEEEEEDLFGEEDGSSPLTRKRPRVSSGKNGETVLESVLKAMQEQPRQKRQQQRA